MLEIGKGRNAIRNGIGKATSSDLNYGPLDERFELNVLAEKQEVLSNEFSL
ncbi:MAG TPA: hypothetical protein PJ998_06655 [Terrimesophilobacter sp.]|nr:hypothetical protein [Terrimesophilobacter sp.]